MSRLDELIQELCPAGVELRKIKEVYTRLKGTPITAGKMKEIDNPNGDIKVFAGGKTVIKAFEEDIPRANIIRVPAVLVQSRGVIDAVYYEEPFTFKNEMWAYTADEKTSVKYLYYVLKNNIQQFRVAASGMGSMPQISLKVTEEFIIPVPPLPVQSEIVRILDNFTELTAELTASKQQYEYYRDSLLTFGDDVPLVTLGEIAAIVRGGNFQKKDFTETGVPCIHYGQIYTKYGLSATETITFINEIVAKKSKFASKNDIVMAVTSENIEDVCKCVVWLGEDDAAISGHTAIIKHNQNSKFLAYYFHRSVV